MAVETMVQPPRTMLEVFEGLPEGTPVQIIENTLVMSPSPVPLHQWIVGEVFGELRSFLKKSKTGVVWLAPSDVYFDELNVYQPDVFVVLGTPPSKPPQNKKAYHGVPDLVVEVLSPGTAKYDLNEKKTIYERFGVTEYWVIDPEEYIATGYYLVNDEYHQFFSEKGILESKLLNCKIEF